MQEGRGVGCFFNSVPLVPCIPDVFLKYFSGLNFPYQDSKALVCHKESLNDVSSNLVVISSAPACCAVDSPDVCGCVVSPFVDSSGV